MYHLQIVSQQSSVPAFAQELQAESHRHLVNRDMDFANKIALEYSYH